jgi:hypothetical protein
MRSFAAMCIARETQQLVIISVSCWQGCGALMLDSAFSIVDWGALKL